MSKRIYIGPYVVARFRDEVEGIRVTSCTKASCPRYGLPRHGFVETRFCGECGSEIGEVDATRPKRPDLKHVVSRDGGLFLITTGHVDLIIGCYDRAGSPRNFLNDDDQDLTSVDPVAEMRWFSETNAADIVAIDGAYDQARVRWGIVTWEESDW